jgi:hypothetical protein
LKYVVAKRLADALGGSISQLSLSPPVAPTLQVLGTPGSTSRSYRVVAVSPGGKTTAASSAATTTTSATTLSTTDFVRVSWAAVAGANGYLVYRGTDGVIARVGPGEARSVDDTGLTGDGSVFPTTTTAHVEVAVGDPDNEQDYPGASIHPEHFRFEPELGYEEVEDDSLDASGQVVHCVGNWVGSVEIRISALDRPQREAIEAAVEALFNSQEGRRGTIVLSTPPLTINGTITTVEAPVAFVMSDSGWREEFAFTKKRWLFLDVDVEFQALVVRNDTWTIDDYQIVLQCIDEMQLVVNDETVRIVPA